MLCEELIGRNGEVDGLKSKLSVPVSIRLGF